MVASRFLRDALSAIFGLSELKGSSDYSIWVWVVLPSMFNGEMSRYGMVVYLEVQRGFDMVMVSSRMSRYGMVVHSTFQRMLQYGDGCNSTFNRMSRYVYDMYIRDMVKETKHGSRDGLLVLGNIRQDIERIYGKYEPFQFLVYCCSYNQMATEIEDTGRRTKLNDDERNSLSVVHDGPQVDDCYPICFGSFSVHFKGPCGHWYCGGCIMEYWNIVAAFRPCKCPMCSRPITKLMPKPMLQQNQLLPLGQPSAPKTSIVVNARRNNESKKCRRNLLKQLYETLSLPSVWHVVATMIRGQHGLDELDFDDLYNNLKVYKHELKGASSLNSQSIAFMSAEIKGSTSRQSTADDKSEIITKGYAQASSSKLKETLNSSFNSDDGDLLQIDDDAMEEIDIR
ncbi:RING/U-box superfamily protein [Tanacetum coccineum]